MISVSNTVKQNCNKDSLKYREFIIIDNKQIDIIGELNATAYKDTTFFGTFNMKMLKFEAENNIDYKNKELTYYKEVNGESFKIGTFIVTDVNDSDTEETTSVVAYDYGLKFANNYVSNLNYASGNVTMYDVLVEVCRNCGVILENTSIPNGSFIVDSNQFVNEETYGDVIAHIAIENGTFATINDNDKLELIFKKETNEIIEDYIELEDKRDTHPITCVLVAISKDLEETGAVRKDQSLIAQYGENWLKVYDYAFAYSTEKCEQLINAIFNQVKGFGYSSFKTDYAFKPYMTLGDTLKFKNKNGDLVESILLKYNTNYDEIVFEAPSITSASVEYDLPETPQDKILRVNFKLDQQNKTIKGLISDINEQGSKITTLEATTSGISTRVERTEKDVSTLNTNYGNLQGQVNGMQTDFDDFYDNEYIQSIENLQDQIDGAIQFWNGEDIPTLNNYPANQWTTEDERNNHQADIYTVIKNDKQGKSYRFAKVSGVWKWVELTDNELSAVQKIAQDALAKAQNNETEIGKTNTRVSNLEQTDTEIKASVNELNKDTTLKKTISGYPIEIEDAGHYEVQKNVIYGNCEQETPIPYPSNSNIIGLGTNKSRVNLKKGDKITLTNNTSSQKQIDCFTTINDTTRNDYWTVNANTTRTVTLAYDTDVINWSWAIDGVAWINKGSTSLTYEEYVPTYNPSPDYPIEIKNVGVCNLVEKNIKGYVNDKTNNIIIDNDSEIFIFYVEKGKAYTRVCKTNLTNNRIAKVNSIDVINNENVTNVRNLTSDTFVSDFTGYCAWYVNNVKNDEISKSFIVTKGTKSNTYVPYGNWLVEKINGKNLFNNKLSHYTINADGTFNTSTPTYRISCDYEKCEPNKNYILSTNKNVNSFIGIAYYTKDKTFISRTGSSSTYTHSLVAPSNAKYIRAFVTYGDEELNEDSLGTHNIQLEEGSTPTSYEPYKENIVKFSLNKVNLFDKDNAQILNAYLGSGKINSSDTAKTIYIKCKPNTTYTVSKIAGQRFAIAYSSALPVVGGSVDNMQQNNTSSSLKITTASDSEYLIVWYYSGAYDVSITEENMRASVKIYEGTDTTPYYELNKIGDVADEFDSVTGILTKRIGKVVLNGSENWLKSGATSSSIFVGALNISDWNNKFATGFSWKITHFSYGNLGELDKFNTYNGNEESGYMHIAFSIKTTVADTLEKFKTWLSQNKPIVYYQLKEPEIIQLEKNSPLLYEGYNRITIDGDVNPSNMTIDYLTHSKFNDMYANRAEVETEYATNSYVDLKSDSLVSRIEEVNTIQTQNYENAVKTSDFESYQTQVSTQFTQTKESFQFDFDTLNKNIQNVDGKVVENKNELNKYIRFIDGDILLGESGNEYTLRIENDRVVIYYNGQNISSWIEDVFTANQINIGKFSFIPRANGSLSFRKRSE